MKTFKKIIAVFMAVLMVLSIGAVSVSAAAAPTFELKIVSQDDKSAVLELSLVSGEFNSFDVAFKTSSRITFKSLYATDDFEVYMRSLKKSGAQLGESASAQNKKISFASTAAVNKSTSLYEINVVKSTADDIVAKDITAVFSECMVGNKSMPSSVKTTYVFGKIELDDSLELNYKQYGKINIDTTYKADGIQWKSSNTKVAVVDVDGTVYAAGTGSAVITAQNADGSVSDTCKVTVSYAWWQWIIVIVLFGWIWY